MLDEYVDALVRDAMGRLFWSYERAMAAECLVIIMALQGQAELLRELFGGASEPAPIAAKEPEYPPLTPEILRGMFRNG